MTEADTKLDQNSDDIYLFEIIQKILDSKKIIILTTLFFSLISSIYILQKAPVYYSSALVEFGRYIQPDGSPKLVETPDNLIRAIKVDLLYKSSKEKILNELSLTSIENRFLEIEYYSPSSKDNDLLLNNIVNYIVERQTLMSEEILKKRPTILRSKITRINKEIEFEESRKIDNIKYLQNKISHFNNLISKNNVLSETFTSNESLYLSQKLLQASVDSRYQLLKEDLELELFKEEKSRTLFDLIAKKNEWLSELELLSEIARLQTKAKLIGEIKTSKKKSSIVNPFLISTIFGIFFGFLIVFLRSFAKKLQ